MSALREMIATRRVVGTFVKLPGTTSIALARQHFDFAIVDREHSTLGEHEALAMIGHGAALGLPTLLRVPTLDAGEVNRALEAGAAGIQLSQVRSPEEVQALRAACEYAPHGERSVSLGHPVAGFGATPLPQYIQSSVKGALVVAQLESRMDPGRYAEVMSAGPDVAFIGVTDLTVDCGFEAAAVEEAIDQIAQAAAASAITLGAFGLAQREQVRYLVASSDVAMLRGGMAQEARGALAPVRDQREEQMR